jgi:hypothetical protein
MNRNYGSVNVNHLIHRTIHNLQNVSMNIEQMNENDQWTLIQQLNAVNQMIESRRHHHRFPLPPPLMRANGDTGGMTSYRDMHAHSAGHALSHGASMFSFNIPSENNRIRRHEEYESPDGMHISISEFVADDMQGFNDGFNRIMHQALSSFTTIFSDRFNISIGGDAMTDLSAPPPQRGLNEEYKSFLPVAPYSEMKLEEEEHSVACTICQVKFEDATQVRCLPCSHLFHVECIDHWLTRGTICPNCRDDIDTSLSKLKNLSD